MNAALCAVNDFMAGFQQSFSHHPVQLRLQHITLRDALAPVIDEYRHWCREKRITLRYLSVDEPIQTDVQQLQRIVRNLLSNALRYTPAGGRIVVGCRRREGRRWLVVLDSGTGMNAGAGCSVFRGLQALRSAEPRPRRHGPWAVQRQASRTRTGPANLAAQRAGQRHGRVGFVEQRPWHDRMKLVGAFSNSSIPRMCNTLRRRQNSRPCSPPNFNSDKKMTLNDLANFVQLALSAALIFYGHNQQNSKMTANHEQANFTLTGSSQ